jgi:hypothetical protein
VEALWDSQLRTAMATHARVVHEEAVVETLIGDLVR